MTHPRGLRARRDARATRRLVEGVGPYTMVYPATLEDLCTRTREVVDAGVPGDLVECGVWRGGSAFLMAQMLDLLGDADRSVWMFDSFEGLPPPQEVDGSRAAAYAADRDNPLYFDNCRAAVEEVRSTAAALGVEQRARIVPGWFDATLPATRDEVGPISLLRLDCDWHEPVTTCLESLYDQVSEGGTVIVDDYYTFDGCAVAVHEFLGRRGLSHRLKEAAGVAYFRKD